MKNRYSAAERCRFFSSADYLESGRGIAFPPSARSRRRPVDLRLPVSGQSLKTSALRHGCCCGGSGGGVCVRVRAINRKWYDHRVGDKDGERQQSSGTRIQPVVSVNVLEAIRARAYEQFVAVSYGGQIDTRLCLLACRRCQRTNVRECVCVCVCVCIFVCIYALTRRRTVSLLCVHARVNRRR
jgi:hypothetical protein